LLNTGAATAGDDCISFSFFVFDLDFHEFAGLGGFIERLASVTLVAEWAGAATAAAVTRESSLARDSLAGHAGSDTAGARRFRRSVVDSRSGAADRTE
jgi:hypothetical protein